ncbi:ectodermal cell fate commitment [Halocaridina rubra]|uniref:Ectodermal cell fate commitment n=1 Tax=Halocaridina rubra TaxID=373956 RepID=A0AAN8X5Q5_HALRR
MSDHWLVLENNGFSVIEVCKALMELDAHKPMWLDDVSSYDYTDGSDFLDLRLEPRDIQEVLEDQSQSDYFRELDNTYSSSGASYDTYSLRDDGNEYDRGYIPSLRGEHPSTSQDTTENLQLESSLAQLQPYDTNYDNHEPRSLEILMQEPSTIEIQYGNIRYNYDPCFSDISKDGEIEETLINLSSSYDPIPNNYDPGSHDINDDSAFSTQISTKPKAAHLQKEPSQIQEVNVKSEQATPMHQRKPGRQLDKGLPAFGGGVRQRDRPRYNNKERRKKPGVDEATSEVKELLTLETDHLLQKIPAGNRNKDRGPKNWEYLARLLLDPKMNPEIIRWENKKEGIFSLVRPDIITKIWQSRDNNQKVTDLTYNSFARGLRHHYKTGHLECVSKEQKKYKFGPIAMEFLEACESSQMNRSS